MTGNKHEALPNICIYHANCLDGFTAAWVAWRKYGSTYEYCPSIYGYQHPDVTDKNVLILDFSYPLSVMLELASIAKSVTILDHHKAMSDNLGNLLISGGPKKNIFGTYDVAHSGAMMAWMHLFPESAPTELLRYVQDYDLWQHKLDGSKEIHAALTSYPYDFRLWDGFMHYGKEGISRLRIAGEAILRKQEQDLHTLLPLVITRERIGGYLVPCANLPYTMRDMAGELMGKNERFSATYYMTATHRVYSLRSDHGIGMDVNAIAKIYGGGGHVHAAGFKLEHGRGLDIR